MKQEEKRLLLINLCARLPYGVKGIHREQVHIISNIDGNSLFPSIKVDGYDAWFPIETFKPYLRPMSSMTEEELIEYHKFGYTQWYCVPDAVGAIDWLNSHHFDYRGLIKKGLALEAPKNMYKTK